MDIDPQLQALGLQLAQVAARNTASAVADRLSTMRSGRKAEQTIAELHEIIQELVDDKNELVQISQAFQSELAGRQLSTEDINYITGELVPLIEQLVNAIPGQANAAQARQTLDLLKSLLSVETLTILQLIGFSVKRAIGEPLTDLVRQLVLSKAPTDPDALVSLQRVSAERDIALASLAGDQDAFARLQAITGRT